MSVDWTDDHFEDINAVLQSLNTTGNFMGGYCMGFLQMVIIQETGTLPTREMLQAGARCNTLDEAGRVAMEFVKQIKAEGPILDALTRGGFTLAQCAATTKRGRPCRRYAETLSRFCGQHTQKL